MDTNKPVAERCAMTLPVDDSRMTLQKAFEDLEKAALRVKAERDELLAALQSALNTIKALDEDYDLRESYKQGEAAIAKATRP